PLGFSYYRLNDTIARASGPADSGTSELQSLVTHQAGVTILQSLVPSLAIGTTLKLVRGRAAHDIVTDTGADPIDTANALPAQSSTAFDLDVGAMASVGLLRLGVVVRNVREPTFETPDETGLSLSRQARIGVALVARRAWAVAVDADITRTDTALGERRNVAAGVERWLLGSRVGFRGGVRINTVGGDAQPVGSLGATLHLTPTFAVDAHWADSESPADRGWGIAGRMTF
ncbi:MAG: conjugal transfer protein TraF, partial [Vicinamibacteraceae bacterium]